MFVKRDKFKIKIYYFKGYYDNILVGELILMWDINVKEF